MICNRRTPKNPCPTCKFTGNFTYSSSNCLLTLVINKLGCDPLLSENLNVTIIGPDGEVDSTGVISGNTYTWKLYKATLGDWEATVILLCGENDETGTYNITIDDDYDCQCCLIMTPNTMTVNSSASCCSFGNGTYAVEIEGTCTWGKTTVIYTYPVDPCPSSPCFTLRSGTTNWYFHPWRVTTQIFLDGPGGIFGVPVGFLTYWYIVYRQTDGGTCVISSPSIASLAWVYRFNCEDGNGVPTTDFGSTNGILAYKESGLGKPTLTASPCGTLAPSLSVDFL